MIYQSIVKASEKKTRQLAVLIDPDKTDEPSLVRLSGLLARYSVDYILVGGSLITSSFLSSCIQILKSTTQIPVVLFPGSTLHINDKADAILLLSLISGRNPELLIGNHVAAAPVLSSSGLEIISTGYMLIESGKLTSVVYMSNTIPIPSDKNDIACCTAMAGEMLGMKLIYMDAGSGACNPIPSAMISSVKSMINIPLIIGGGIRDAGTARKIWDSGADVIVIGNGVEKHNHLIEELCMERDKINKVNV
jgi:phosphoglycerol geranylgeranyltransferase